MSSLLEESFPPPVVRAPGDSFPVRTGQVAAEIDGVHTEIVMNLYAEQIFIVISQTQKLGSLISASRVGGQMTQSGVSNYSINTLLGKRDDPVLDIFARQLVQYVSNTDRMARSLLLAISLPSMTAENMRPTFHAVMNLISENKIW
eukprot:TRINITY_DN9180_c0_g1_i2.p1 TRINITY_DN9180_c0_g1~~TRINITY_DN9180_c0_g1_i2.p1  ORF type:complete len:146 (+),score=20.32 TRINITY_DN9180_c0_g1_i2:2-439(+)